MCAYGMGGAGGAVRHVQDEDGALCRKYGDSNVHVG